MFRKNVAKGVIMLGLAGPIAMTKGLISKNNKIFSVGVGILTATSLVVAASGHAALVDENKKISKDEE